jgi:hypothetical protein
METWMYAARLSAIKQYGISPDPTQARRDLAEKFPARTRYIGDNWNHLNEQPPWFAVVAVSLAVLGDRSKWTVSFFSLSFSFFLLFFVCIAFPFLGSFPPPPSREAVSLG